VTRRYRRARPTALAPRRFCTTAPRVRAPADGDQLFRLKSEIRERRNGVAAEQRNGALRKERKSKGFRARASAVARPIGPPQPVVWTAS
jgi:hypothetical protein